MNLSTRYIVGDVLEVLRAMPDASVDLVMSSPPFLALRSYLPADHPDKAKEIGSEATPAEFIDTLLDVVEECRRVLTPFGSFVFELGDTYAGSGGAGGDYNDKGMRDGQPKFGGSKSRATDKRPNGRPAGASLMGRYRVDEDGNSIQPDPSHGGAGWPLDKSLTGIPTLFTWSLAYGRNLLNPDRTIEPWRIRNVVAWCRPNPPVGALADKFRPATSYMTVATIARDRYFDGDAVRVPSSENTHARLAAGTEVRERRGKSADRDGNWDTLEEMADTGPDRPLYDYWEIATQGYKGSHYATFPEELPRRVILSMCPERVCLECGEPSRRIVERESAGIGFRKSGENRQDQPVSTLSPDNATRSTVGWTDCGHNAWRPGIVLDPFAGSGTTLRMALGNGRSSIGIDLDSRNADLAAERVGPLYLDVETLAQVA